MRFGPNRHGRWYFAVATLLLLFAGETQVVRGEDLVTVSGNVYHDVQALRVEPDGVTWQYAEGVAKVDFTDSPETVRQRFHYEAAKASAYHSAQMQARQEADTRTRQAIQENNERRLARAQAVAANAAAKTATDTDIIFRRGASPAASEATRALAEQAEAAAAKRAIAPMPFWDALAHSRVGTVLKIFGVNFGPGGPPPDKDEYKIGLHHAGGTAPALGAAQDAFYTPNYSTRSYYEDVDRSNAFLRGVPLKP